MVDLVKIRKKKAAEKKANDETAAAEKSSANSADGPAPEEAAPAADDAGGLSTSAAGPLVPEALPVAPTESGDAPRPTTSKLERFKQEAGKRREFGAVQAEDAVPVDQLELLTFVIAGEHYAVDIERIVEIVTPRPVTRIPNADASVVGIISLRGTIVTLVDVRRKLRHPPAGEAGVDARIVVIDFEREMVGFIVDRVLRVVKAASGTIEPHPVVHATELDDSIRGVFRTGGALTILLDLDKLLDHRALAARTA